MGFSVSSEGEQTHVPAFVSTRDRNLRQGFVFVVFLRLDEAPLGQACCFETTWRQCVCVVS